MLLFFFFSSRRRHTRLTCDWSSDVCSSDLALSRQKPAAAQKDISHAKCLARKGVKLAVVAPPNWPPMRPFRRFRFWTHECSLDRKSTRLNSSHMSISYAVFCLKKKKKKKYR